MTPTDELRAMLDEQGTEHEDTDNPLCRYTEWKCGLGLARFYEDETDGYTQFNLFHSDGMTYLQIESDLTPPERYVTVHQAIAATLGAGTCHEVMIDKFSRGCSECGYMWEYMYGIGNRSGPNFCPNCGKRVVR